MRTVFILFCIASFIFFCVNKVFAAGIYHNSNQSAEFVRTQKRNASTDVDAVFYNPEGRYV